VPGLVLDDGRAVFLALGCLSFLDFADDIDDVCAVQERVVIRRSGLLRLRWEAERFPGR